MVSLPPPRSSNGGDGANRSAEIKLVIAAVYSNFRTHIVDDEGIEQMDGYTTGPTSNRLILRFEKVVDQ